MLHTKGIGKGLAIKEETKTMFKNSIQDVTERLLEIINAVYEAWLYFPSLKTMKRII